MRVEVDITKDLELEIRRRIHPVEIHGWEGYTGESTDLLWNLKAGTLTGPVHLSNGTHGEKAVQVSVLNASPIEVSIALAFEFVDFIRKENKKQVAKKRWTRPINEMLAMHELFRKMGFKADDLFFNFGGGGEIQFELRGQKIEFAINVVGDQSILRPDGRTAEQLRAEFLRASSWWNGNAATDAERATIYNRSTIRSEAVGVVLALKAKGIEPPIAMN